MINSQGLHARPAELLVVAANRFQAKVTIRHGNTVADGKSILEVIGLAAPQGSTLLLEAEGEDAPELIQAVAGIVNRGFDEM